MSFDFPAWEKEREDKLKKWEEDWDKKFEERLKVFLEEEKKKQETWWKNWKDNNFIAIGSSSSDSSSSSGSSDSSSGSDSDSSSGSDNEEETKNKETEETINKALQNLHNHNIRDLKKELQDVDVKALRDIIEKTPYQGAQRFLKELPTYLDKKEGENVTDLEVVGNYYFKYAMKEEQKKELLEHLKEEIGKEYAKLLQRQGVIIRVSRLDFDNMVKNICERYLNFNVALKAVKKTLTVHEITSMPAFVDIFREEDRKHTVEVEEAERRKKKSVPTKKSIEVIEQTTETFADTNPGPYRLCMLHTRVTKLCTKKPVEMTDENGNGTFTRTYIHEEMQVQNTMLKTIDEKIGLTPFVLYRLQVQPTKLTDDETKLTDDETKLTDDETKLTDDEATHKVYLPYTNIESQTYEMRQEQNDGSWTEWQQIIKEMHAREFEGIWKVLRPTMPIQQKDEFFEYKEDSTVDEFFSEFKDTCLDYDGVWCYLKNANDEVVAVGNLNKNEKDNAFELFNLARADLTFEKKLENMTLEHLKKTPMKDIHTHTVKKVNADTLDEEDVEVGVYAGMGKLLVLRVMQNFYKTKSLEDWMRVFPDPVALDHESYNTTIESDDAKKYWKDFTEAADAKWKQWKRHRDSLRRLAPTQKMVQTPALSIIDTKYKRWCLTSDNKKRDTKKILHYGGAYIVPDKDRFIFYDTLDLGQKRRTRNVRARRRTPFKKLSLATSLKDLQFVQNKLTGENKKNATATFNFLEENFSGNSAADVFVKQIGSTESQWNFEISKSDAQPQINIQKKIVLEEVYKKEGSKKISKDIFTLPTLNVVSRNDVSQPDMKELKNIVTWCGDNKRDKIDLQSYFNNVIVEKCSVGNTVQEETVRDLAVQESGLLTSYCNFYIHHFFDVKHHSDTHMKIDASVPQPIVVYNETNYKLLEVHKDKNVVTLAKDDGKKLVVSSKNCTFPEYSQFKEDDILDIDKVKAVVVFCGYQLNEDHTYLCREIKLEDASKEYILGKKVLVDVWFHNARLASDQNIRIKDEAIEEYTKNSEEEDEDYKSGDEVEYKGKKYEITAIGDDDKMTLQEIVPNNEVTSAEIHISTSELIKSDQESARNEEKNEQAFTEDNIVIYNYSIDYMVQSFENYQYTLKKVNDDDEKSVVTVPKNDLETCWILYAPKDRKLWKVWNISKILNVMQNNSKLYKLKYEYYNQTEQKNKTTRKSIKDVHELPDYYFPRDAYEKLKEEDSEDNGRSDKTDVEEDESEESDDEDYEDLVDETNAPDDGEYIVLDFKSGDKVQHNDVTYTVSISTETNQDEFDSAVQKIVAFHPEPPSLFIDHELRSFTWQVYKVKKKDDNSISLQPQWGEEDTADIMFDSSRGWSKFENTYETGGKVEIITKGTKVYEIENVEDNGVYKLRGENTLYYEKSLRNHEEVLTDKNAALTYASDVLHVYKLRDLLNKDTQQYKIYNVLTGRENFADRDKVRTMQPQAPTYLNVKTVVYLRDEYGNIDENKEYVIEEINEKKYGYTLTYQVTNEKEVCFLAVQDKNEYDKAYGDDDTSFGSDDTDDLLDEGTFVYLRDDNYNVNKSKKYKIVGQKRKDDGEYYELEDTERKTMYTNVLDVEEVDAQEEDQKEGEDVQEEEEAPTSTGWFGLGFLGLEHDDRAEQHQLLQ